MAAKTENRIPEEEQIVEEAMDLDDMEAVAGGVSPSLISKLREKQQEASFFKSET